MHQCKLNNTKIEAKMKIGMKRQKGKTTTKQSTECSFGRREGPPKGRTEGERENEARGPGGATEMETTTINAEEQKEKRQRER